MLPCEGCLKIEYLCDWMALNFKVQGDELLTPCLMLVMMTATHHYQVNQRY